MHAGIRHPLAALLLVCLLLGCKGTITSPEPLITAATASYPFPAMIEIEAQNLSEDHVWERSEGKGRLTLVDRSYRVTGPGDAGPSSDTYLFKQIRDGMYVVQASNGNEWAYGLIVRADSYYVFTFNLDKQNCTNLSAAELGRFNATIKDDGCSVSTMKDLTGLLLHLRQQYPYPTSAFTVR
jgi:hypothetical protein